MSKFVLLFVCVALLQIASALKCYSCENDLCAKEMSAWNKVEACGNTVSSNQVGACLKTVWTDNNSKKEMTSRRCIIADKDGDKVKYTCREDKGKVSVCDVCVTDWCNSAPAVSFSVLAFSGVLLAYLIPKLM
ncbi:uncharacterized protein LOC132699451 [Cylas formicarius]|uniref:uncharacterized protein LOC132699451 n=1 Tax=Cylas formicarius TaxID=197179 RepID=UPI002958CE7E|nr:uncharacterized protein LOC132699451 [Cylas formicarius]